MALHPPPCLKESENLKTQHFSNILALLLTRTFFVEISVLHLHNLPFYYTLILLIILEII